MAYEVVLELYAGPLDLLLHLIQKQELNIHDIPIAEITEQYLAHLRTMEELSLDVASEFVVMAATLLAIKSRMLLPRQQKVTEDGELIEVDPREELIRQLVEYQKCKWAASELKIREALRALSYAREPMDLRPFADHEPPPVQGVTIWSLVDAFRQLVQRLPKDPYIAEIKQDVERVEDAMETLIQRLRLWKRCTFFELLAFAKARHQVVSAFLALLELMKDGAITCIQNESFGAIEVEWTGENSGCSFL